jgi:hypothetical protein
MEREPTEEAGTIETGPPKQAFPVVEVEPVKPFPLTDRQSPKTSKQPPIAVDASRLTVDIILTGPLTLSRLSISAVPAMNEPRTLKDDPHTDAPHRLLILSPILSDFETERSKPIWAFSATDIALPNIPVEQQLVVPVIRRSQSALTVRLKIVSA